MTTVAAPGTTAAGTAVASGTAAARPHPAGLLVVARHGRTAWNAQGRFQGQADPSLDRTGRAQAMALGRQARGWALDAVVSSDLQRARQTAHIVAGHAGCGVVVDARLREQALGRWEGLRAAEAADRFPQEWAAWRAGCDVRRGGAESAHDAGRRAAGALLDLIERSGDGARLLVVSHGIALQAALSLLADAGKVHLPEPLSHLDNGSWLELAVGQP